jgi:hypothetical protein
MPLISTFNPMTRLPLLLLTIASFAYPAMGTKVTPNPGLFFWTDVVNNENGLFESEAFGWLMYDGHPKVHLYNHGWWEIGAGTIEGFWAYDYALETWLWTSREAYPNYYDESHQTWMQFDLSTKPAREATDLTLSRKITLSPTPGTITVLNLTGNPEFTGFFHSTPNGTTILNAESSGGSFSVDQYTGLIKDGVPAIIVTFNSNYPEHPYSFIAGEYYLNFDIYGEYVRISFSGPDVPGSTFAYIPRTSLSGTSPQFAAAFSDEIDIRQVADELVLGGIENLIKWGWNLIPFIPDIGGLKDLETRLRSIRHDVDALLVHIEEGTTQWLESNPSGNLVEQSYQDVYSSILSPHPYASDTLLIEGQDRLDESVQIERQYADTLGSITDESGTVVDQEKFLIKGQVLDGLVIPGNPVPHQPIYLFAGPDQSTHTNSNGEFVFMVPEGNYSVEVQSEDYVFQYFFEQPFQVPSEDAKNLLIYRKDYLRPDLMIVDAKAKRRYGAAGQEDFWIDYLIQNNGNATTKGQDMGAFVISTDYECMVGGSCSYTIGGGPNIQAGIEPGGTGWVRANFTIPDWYDPGSKVYTMGLVWMGAINDWSVKTALPKVQFAICDGTYDGLPVSLPGWALDFTWEDTNGDAVSPGTSTIFNFFSNGGISAYDSDTGQPQLTPVSYSWSSNGSTAILEMQFDNNTNGQVITGTSTYVITWDTGCGGTYTGDVEFFVNGSRLHGSGSGFFMLKQSQ